MRKSRILSIAGSDPSGGAGIQADIKAITWCGGYAMTAISAITIQNTLGVQEVIPVDTLQVSRQMEACIFDIGVDAVKIGLMGSIDTMRMVADTLQKERFDHVVVDPIMVSTSGYCFLETSDIKWLDQSFFPMASVVTPNIPEAEILVGRPLSTVEDMEWAAHKLSSRWGNSVLVKGGHLEGEKIDVLAVEGKTKWYSYPEVVQKNTHGTGCLLSSALATFLAQGRSLLCGVNDAKKFVYHLLLKGLDLGKGNGPLL